MASSLESYIIPYQEIIESDQEISLEKKINPVEVNKYWLLPGNRSNPNRSTCGKLLKMGKGKKLNDHTSQLEDHYYPHFQHCYDKNCPLCFGAWARRSSERVATRLFSISQALEVPLYHWTYSPKNMALDFKSVQKHYNICKSFLQYCQTTVGAYIIFHPFRNEDELMHSGKWILSPHFHIITDLAFCNDINVQFKKYQAVFKRISKVEKLESFRTLVAYEMSHAGISLEKKNSQVGKWMGAWSYAKLKTLVIKVKQAQLDDANEYIHKCKLVVTDFRQQVHHLVSGTKFMAVSNYNVKTLDELFYQKVEYALVFFQGSKLTIEDYIRLYHLYDVASAIPIRQLIEDKFFKKFKTLIF